MCRFVGAPTCDDEACGYCHGDEPLQLDPDVLTARGVRKAAIVALGWASPLEVVALDDADLDVLVTTEGRGEGCGSECVDPYCVRHGENIDRGLPFAHGDERDAISA